MTFGDLVALIGAAELLVLVLGLAAMVSSGTSPPHLINPDRVEEEEQEGRPLVKETV